MDHPLITNWFYVESSSSLTWYQNPIYSQYIWDWFSKNYYLERHILNTKFLTSVVILGWTGAEVEAGAPGAGLSPGGEDASSADSLSGKGRDDVIDADFTNSNEKMN